MLGLKVSLLCAVYFPNADLKFATMKLGSSSNAKTVSSTQKATNKQFPCVLVKSQNTLLALT